MSSASKPRTADISALAPVTFYGAVGIILLVLLPLTNFPPHVGLTGVLSLITAYGLLKKSFWAIWLVGALFAVATTFSLYTLFFIGFSNLVVGLSMVAYAILTWVFTVYLILKRKAAET
jgi:hypothetical protein